MELLRTLLLLLLSWVPFNGALTATGEVATKRARLLQLGMSPAQVKRLLGLDTYQWLSAGNAGAVWFSSFLSPGDGHIITVWYLEEPRTCELRLTSVEISPRVGRAVAAAGGPLVLQPR